jgi:hypothetical protein
MFCVRMERKSLKVLIWIPRQVPGAHTIILYVKGCYVQNSGKRTGESFLCWNSPRQRQCQVCNDIFGHVMEIIRQPGSVSTTGTSVGRAGLSIWHCRVTLGAHILMLVRCENNFESSPFNLYIIYVERRHMFNSTYKINFWKRILLE